MIPLPVNAKLANALDIIIKDYKGNGKLMGEPNESPNIEEATLIELLKSKKDIPVAPDVYAYFMDNYDTNLIAPFAQALFPKNKLLSASGRFHYPPKGFMGWHTNSNMSGWRVYATRVDESDKSFFRYYANNRVHTEWEKKGWNFRAFQVKPNNPYWHCVWSDTNRYSFGFRFDG